MDRGSGSGSDGIPLRTLVNRTSTLEAMNKKASRSNLLTANTRRKTASRNKLRDSDDEVHQSLLRSHGAGPGARGARGADGRSALTGELEQDGSFDAGWKGSGAANEHDDDDEEQALLEEGRILVSLPRLGYLLAG